MSDSRVMAEVSRRFKLAVVIPYFQREKGILAACVQSVLAQARFDDYVVVVVDDGSPVPARDELGPLLRDDGRIRLLEQQNRGPGAARNAGLNSLDPGTEYVAFLDSDDQWTPEFLSDAVAALDRGYDLFFGNTQRYGIEETRFDWDAPRGRNLDPRDHAQVEPERGIHEFVGDFFDFSVFRSSVVSTSAMAYRFARWPQLRFSETLFNGQDRLFKLMLCRGTQAVAFTPKICAVEGKGVNIFDSSRWGSGRSLRFLCNYIKLAKAIRENVPLNERQARHVRDQLRESRYSFAATMLHLLRRRLPLDLKVVMETFRSDPASAGCLLPNMLRAVVAKAGVDR